MGYDRFAMMEFHVGDDPWETVETQARFNWYGGGGIPHVVIDGIGHVVGGIDNDCEANAARYRAYNAGRLAETGGLSPVHIVSNLDIVGSTATVSATYKLIEAADLGLVRATLFLYQDNVGPGDEFQHVVLEIYSENVTTLTELGDEFYVEQSWTINPAYVDDYGAAVCLQNYSTKEVVQAQVAGYGTAPDYSSWFTSTMGSVPQGNGMVEFEGTLFNIGDATDTFTLEPGTAFGDWMVDFIVCGSGDPHTDPVEVVLNAGEMCDFTVRVHTDAVIEERIGSFLISALSTGRSSETTLRVFNGSMSILFVDDDRSHTDDEAITEALDNLGVLYEHWDIAQEHGDNSPTYAYMRDFDVLIWHHSQWPQADPLSEGDVATIMSYMDNGGSLFLTSQLFLNDPLGPLSFISDYLGIADYTVDANYTDVSGVTDDPIGDGLVLPLGYTIPTLARGDHVVPGPTATLSLVGDPGDFNAGIRNEMGRGAKSFFMGFAFEAISDTDPDPNNTTTVLGRILEWLGPPTVDVDDQSIAVLGSRIDGARPNPFNPRTEIAITLSQKGASGPVSLAIYDLAGRKVAGIHEGTLKAGTHVRTWNGTADNGSVMQSGVYFAKLKTIEGVFSDKLILLK